MYIHLLVYFVAFESIAYCYYCSLCAFLHLVSCKKASIPFEILCARVLLYEALSGPHKWLSFASVFIAKMIQKKSFDTI